MPLGEVIGLKLPQKSKLPVILGFAFILGAGATFAEPAISVLKAASSSVKSWDAPLLFLMLNRYSGYLVMSVAAGVGLAVVLGMIRFMYNLSLKPFIYSLVTLLLGFTFWSFFNENMQYITGLAWDCGGVTTGPVTVPLVLALGIGICRVVGSTESGSSGFGVVTLASLLPVIAVLSLGAVLLGSVPQPMSETEFFSVHNREKAQVLFTSREEMIGYAFRNAGESSQFALFEDNHERLLDYLKSLKTDEKLRSAVFGPGADVLEKWVSLQGTAEQQMAIFLNREAVYAAAVKYGGIAEEAVRPADLLLRNIMASAQAIIPLSIFFYSC